MNILLIILLVLAILLLAVICGGLMYLLKRQERLERRLQQEREMSRASLELTRAMASKVDTVSTQSYANFQTAQSMASQVSSITKVMTNAKKRGTWGEYQLDHLVRTCLGDSPFIYSSQYHLQNGKISDGAFHLPGTDQVLCIDSKFPMENYLKMAAEPEAADFYEKELRRNIKKHIGDVADKYINEETLDEAVLFIPNEGVFAWLCSDGADLMDYALARHVMLVSPTTLSGVVFTLLAATRNFYRAKSMANLEVRLESLEIQAQNVVSACERLGRTEQTLEKQAAELTRQSRKLLAGLTDLSDPDANQIIDD
ncbi:DNA recombination protein RmuC [Erysipelotrichaceae bacterium RD49]|nr:DNA recombination protein RmuC [Erysipelotrichaceae bacterium RD49]